MHKIVCAVCGKEFASNSSRRKYCTECSHYKRKHKTPPMRNAKITIAEMNAAARARGLTYGQYVASLPGARVTVRVPKKKEEDNGNVKQKPRKPL